MRGNRARVAKNIDAGGKNIGEIEQLVSSGKLHHVGSKIQDGQGETLLLVKGDKYFFPARSGDNHLEIEYIPREKRTPQVMEEMQNGDKTAIAFLCSRGVRKSANPFLPNPPSHAWLSLYSLEHEDARDFHFYSAPNIAVNEKCNGNINPKASFGLLLTHLFNSQPAKTIGEPCERGTIQAAIGFPLTKQQELMIDIDDKLNHLRDMQYRLFKPSFVHDKPLPLNEKNQFNCVKYSNHLLQNVGISSSQMLGNASTGISHARPIGISDKAEQIFDDNPDLFVDCGDKIMMRELPNGTIILHMQTPQPDVTEKLFPRVANKWQELVEQQASNGQAQQLTTSSARR